MQGKLPRRPLFIMYGYNKRNKTTNISVLQLILQKTQQKLSKK